MPITYTSNEQVEVYRFSLPAAILIPLIAVFLQAFIPWRFHFFSIFDLPLLVVIFFAVARRSPVAGLLTGAAIGLLQDSLTGHPLGLYGIAKTVVGYGASSLGVKLDVENAGSRFLVVLFFYVVHEIVYFTIARGLVGLTLQWSWPRELGSALANASAGGRAVRAAGSIQAENVRAGFRHRASGLDLGFPAVYALPLPRNCNAILGSADYNKLIFPKGLGQRGIQSGVGLQEPEA